MIPAILIMLITIATVGVANAEARHGMVASVHPVATEAGLRVLKQGGNAIDASVAVALTLGVVDSDNSGIGGGCLMLIHRADGSLVAIDGREMAPAAATSDMFLRNGKADTKLSQTGPLASAVPGAFAAYEFAVEHYGKRKLSDLILPAATADMFLRNGKADTKLSQTGPLASAVPGAFAAYEFAVEHYGKRKLSDLIL